MTRVSLSKAAVLTDDSVEEVLLVDEALGQLERVDPRLCKIVELRFFSGLTVEETAEALSLSPRTVKRDWALARAWLHRNVRHLS
jgi:RNA polymerase sigma factor (TIGR02999 family)